MPIDLGRSRTGFPDPVIYESGGLEVEVDGWEAVSSSGLFAVRDPGFGDYGISRPSCPTG